MQQIRPSDKPGVYKNLSIGHGVFIYDFAFGSSPAWRLSGKSLVIDGPYAGNLNTQVSWFFSMKPNRVWTLVVRGKYDTEKDADILTCGYKILPDGPASLFQEGGWSGKGTLYVTERIEPTGGELEVFCRFVSDENGSGKGIRISSIAIY